MEPKQENEFGLDIKQVKKAVHALQAFLKSTSESQNRLLPENQQICLLLTFWKIPQKDQTIRIPLPHGLHTELTEVCLFTRDEPNMTADQTERFYKKLLTQRGLKKIPDVIPFKVLKTEYKPFEAKRRLLGNFDIFLADARIRRRLPSHIGKHFYARKNVEQFKKNRKAQVTETLQNQSRHFDLCCFVVTHVGHVFITGIMLRAPLSVDLESKHVARDMERLIQGTTLNVTHKGSCCMVRLAHIDMTTDEIVENIVTAVNTISTKLHTTGKNIKVIHLKSHTSVALPIYTADLSHLTLLEEEQKKAKLAKDALKKKKKVTKKSGLKGKNTEKTGLKRKRQRPKNAGAKKTVEDEEIPQLVPIENPRKKTKVEAPSRTGPKKVYKPNMGNRNRKPKQGQKNLGKKALKAQVQKKKKVPSV